MTYGSARWRGLAWMAAGWYRELQEGSKGRRGWQDKGRYGLVVGLDYFSTSYPASISARCLTAPLGICSTPAPPRMAARTTGPFPGVPHIYVLPLAGFAR